MNLIPGYSTGDLCAITPRLSLEFRCFAGSTSRWSSRCSCWPDDEMFATTATLSNYDCNWSGFGCFSSGHVAFDLEIQEPGWSVTGTVDAGTCRAFYDNNSL